MNRKKELSDNLLKNVCQNTYTDDINKKRLKDFIIITHVKDRYRVFMLIFI